MSNLNFKVSFYFLFLLGIRQKMLQIKKSIKIHIKLKEKYQGEGCNEPMRMQERWGKSQER